MARLILNTGVLMAGASGTSVDADLEPVPRSRSVRAGAVAVRGCFIHRSGIHTQPLSTVSRWSSWVLAIQSQFGPCSAGGVPPSAAAACVGTGKDARSRGR